MFVQRWCVLTCTWWRPQSLSGFEKQQLVFAHEGPLVDANQMCLWTIEWPFSTVSNLQFLCCQYCVLFRRQQRELKKDTCRFNLFVTELLGHKLPLVTALFDQSSVKQIGEAYSYTTESCHSKAIFTNSIISLKKNFLLVEFRFMYNPKIIKIYQWNVKTKLPKCDL